MKWDNIFNSLKLNLPWRWLPALLILALLLVPLSSYAPVTRGAGGPVVLGGDDANDHGSWNGTATVDGWKYIRIAFENIQASVTRSGNDGTIAMLGSADSTTTGGGDSGAAGHFAAQEAGITINFFNGDTAINQFFTDLTASTVNPAIIYLPGTGAVAYGWLSALLPNIVEGGGCSQPSTLTDSGISLFPGLASSDISAGPCHSTFSGGLGGLTVLAKDASSLNLLIGSFAATFTNIILKPTSADGEIGTTHTVTATVKQNDVAQVGETVTFKVIDGPNDGQTGTDTTDASGDASFTYTSNGTKGTDKIEAKWTDPVDGQEFTSTVIMIWFGPPSTPDLDAASDAGVSNSDDITKDDTPHLRALPEPAPHWRSLTRAHH